MAKKHEERFEALEQEVSEMKKDLQKLPAVEEKLSTIMKTIERLNVQNEKQQQQHQALMKNLDRLSTKADTQQQQYQVIMKYMDNFVNEKSTTTSDQEGFSSKMKGIANSDESNEETKKEVKDEEDKTAERSKFKKVEMPVFTGNDPDSWLFRADRYFQIHKLTDAEKMTVSIISFDGPALDWFRSQEQRNKFADWSNLKSRLLERFRSIQVAYSELVGLPQMMRLALKAEIREVVRREANLYGYSGGQYLYNPANYNKPNTTAMPNEGKNNITAPMRTITLRSTANGEAKREGPSKRLSDAEFKAKREKGLCFKCDEKYYFGHKCKGPELRELRMFVVHDNNVEEEIVEEECEKLKELNMFELDGGVNAVVELSINSVVGLTNPGTMKVRGKLQGEEIVVLIDCGATYNFISEKLVNEKKLHTKETPHYRVIMGSGTAIKGGVDAILGMQWLYSLGVTETDWRNLTMTFFHEG
ncbi:ty3-gypsy retrotransposon protein [Cucumis melo var. makuwa]|uniref:Ty3-gypsy retrotransposon protein n=1 Tax=Cucumis melo var. makuwa TaxID=1194695 RepID=A0A5A7T5W7_CUCMM|nr:ty3-gypsy retrotransposon protein [Cucumis melo var. makuwa]TYK21214.1 ty3-gypsy retrotransposon protein [Cucumis melo var. makuwa]